GEAKRARPAAPALDRAGEHHRVARGAVTDVAAVVLCVCDQRLADRLLQLFVGAEVPEGTMLDLLLLRFETSRGGFGGSVRAGRGVGGRWHAAAAPGPQNGPDFHAKTATPRGSRRSRVSATSLLSRGAAWPSARRKPAPAQLWPGFG